MYPKILLTSLVVAALFGLRANAQLSVIGVGAFSPSAKLVDFESPSGDEIAITNQYSGLGVTFTGALYTLTNTADVNLFPSAGNQVASNWIYSRSANAGTTIDFWFSSDITRIGAYANFWKTDTLTASVYEGATLLGSFSVLGEYPSSSAFFYGLESTVPFDHVELSISGPGNNFVALDNLRFENAGSTPTAVPEPSTYGMLAALSLVGLTVWRRMRR